MTDRRTYLRRLGAGVGVALLAGCVDEDAASDDGPAGDGSDGDDNSGDGDATTDSAQPIETPPEGVEEWLTDTSNYDGTVANRLDTAQLTIGIGTGVGGLLFDPPVVQVAPGTELRWEWTGRGGVHNVVSVEANGSERALDSGEPIDESGVHYTETLDAEGTYPYSCEPHQTVGMRGAVIVGAGGEVEIAERGDESTHPDYDGIRGAADSYLRDNDANQYRGEFVDLTRQDSVAVAVGVGEQGISFDPPAMVVDPGTEIVWEWTGKDVAHNVVSAEESAFEFDSGEIVQEEGHTFSITVEEVGAHLYYCAPHRAVGMSGAIVVEE